MAHGLPDLPYLGNDERENLIAEQIEKAPVFQRRLCVFQEVGSLEAVTDARQNLMSFRVEFHFVTFYVFGERTIIRVAVANIERDVFRNFRADARHQAVRKFVFGKAVGFVVFRIDKISIFCLIFHFCHTDARADGNIAAEVFS